MGAKLATQGRGQAIVELALVLPLIFLVAGGLFSIWRVAHFKLTLMAAARYGVAVASHGGDGTRAARSYLLENLVTGAGAVDSIQTSGMWPVVKVTVSGRVPVWALDTASIAVSASAATGRAF